MYTTLVLATPDFTKKIIMESDASGYGIGAILMQKGMPLSFESNQLKGKNLLKPIYEKEMDPLPNTKTLQNINRS